MRTVELATATVAFPDVLAQSNFEDAASNVIGIIIGFGLVLAVLSILVIAGKMAATNFQKNARWAARGVDDLPWVLLAVCLMLLAVPLVTYLLAGASNDDAREWEDMLDDVPEGDLGEDPGEPGDDDEDDEDDEDEEDEEDDDEEDGSGEDGDDDEEDDDEEDPGDMPTTDPPTDRV